MLTVRQLKEELSKFKDDDLCYAYEGEVVGIIVTRGSEQGVIHCSDDDNEETKPTRVI